MPPPNAPPSLTSPPPATWYMLLPSSKSPLSSVISPKWVLLLQSAPPAIPFPPHPPPPLPEFLCGGKELLSLSANASGCAAARFMATRRFMLPAVNPWSEDSSLSARLLPPPQRGSGVTGAGTSDAHGPVERWEVGLPSGLLEPAKSSQFCKRAPTTPCSSRGAMLKSGSNILRQDS
eukprot:1139402-Pelagomonas_calceolata.AAC.7